MIIKVLECKHSLAVKLTFYNFYRNVVNVNDWLQGDLTFHKFSEDVSRDKIDGSRMCSVQCTTYYKMYTGQYGWSLNLRKAPGILYLASYITIYY